MCGERLRLSGRSRAEGSLLCDEVARRIRQKQQIAEQSGRRGMRGGCEAVGFGRCGETEGWVVLLTGEGTRFFSPLSSHTNSENVF